MSVECKTGDARLSDEQREARDNLTAMGAVYIVARNAAEAFQGVLALGRAA
jgi:hypothetical protein